MTDAPKRIWIDDERPIGGELHVFPNPPAIGAEDFVIAYHRADLSANLVRAALERAAREALGEGFQGFYGPVQKAIAKRIRAMVKDDEAVEAIITSVLGEPT